MYIGKNILGKEKGLSLIEVMVALAVMTIGIVGACSVLISTHKLNEQTHLKSLAIFAARQKLDDVTIGIHPDTGVKTSIPLMHGVYFSVAGLELNDPDPSVQPGLVNVATVGDLYHIVVMVTWTVPGSNTRNSVRLETVVYAS